MKVRQLLIPSALLAVAVIGYITLAPSTDVTAPEYYGWQAGDTAVRSAELRWGEALDAQRRAEGEWELVHSIALASRLTPSREPLTISVQRDIAPATSRAYETIVRREFAALGPDTKLPITVLLVLDSVRAPHSYRRVVIVPESATDRCVVAVRLALPRRGPGYLPSPRDEMLGTCSYYAKFGMPGARMREWLDRTRARAAAGWTTVAFVREGRQPQEMDLGDVMRAPLVAACMAGRPNTCNRIFDAENRELPYSWPAGSGDTYVVATTTSPRAWSFSSWEASRPSADQLAALRLSVGDERFALIWQSADDPATAFQRSEGYPIDEFVRRQLATEILPYRSGPMVRALPLMLALFLTAGFAVWALARAQRVMT